MDATFAKKAAQLFYQLRSDAGPSVALVHEYLVHDARSSWRIALVGCNPSKDDTHYTIAVVFCNKSTSTRRLQSRGYLAPELCPGIWLHPPHLRVRRFQVVLKAQQQFYHAVQVNCPGRPDDIGLGLAETGALVRYYGRLGIHFRYFSDWRIFHPSWRR